MNWKADYTGDMTLSIIDENGFQVLKVDMLKNNTMKAGTDGSLLVRTMNDLTVIANFSRHDFDFSAEHRAYEDEPISPLPWKLEYVESKRRIVIKNGEGRRIADREFPASTDPIYIQECLQVLQTGIDALNLSDENE